MAWVKFRRRFVYTPSADRRSAVAYTAGWTGSVRRECADRAIAEGAAEALPTPSRSELEEIRRAGR